MAIMALLCAVRASIENRDRTGAKWFIWDHQYRYHEIRPENSYSPIVDIIYNSPSSVSTFSIDLDGQKKKKKQQCGGGGFIAHKYKYRNISFLFPTWINKYETYIL